VIASGLVADLSEQDWVRYLWYICGVAAFLVILWGIWGPLREKSKSQGPELAHLHDRLTVYFTVLWVSYPIVWIIGPSGFGLTNQTVDTFLFCLLPFFSKVGFSFLDLHGLRNLQNSRSQTVGDRVVSRTLQFVDQIAGQRPLRRTSRRTGHLSDRIPDRTR
jgi:bacteriorhodopsin